VIDLPISIGYHRVFMENPAFDTPKEAPAEAKTHWMNHRVSPRLVRTILWLNLWAVGLILGLGLVAWVRHDHELNALIVQSSDRYEVDPLLISAVIWQESRYKADVVGKAGEIGLMQIMEDAANEWAEAEGLDNFVHQDLFDPGKNIAAGTWYLGKAMKQWDKKDDPLPYALAQYNAGRSRARRWDKGDGQSTEAFMETIDIESTRKYIQKITARYNGQRH
jgi:soluble lytic murein transglycosylase